MDGIHDLGGKPGYGKVDQSDADEIFHHRWEAAVFSMTSVGPVTGAWYSSDRFRHAIERIDPETYLAHGYYGRWLGGIETLLVEAGVVTQAEITERAVSLGADPADPVSAKPLAEPDPVGDPPLQRHSKRPLTGEPRFKTGDTVRTSASAVPCHTRLPAYARGKEGTVIACHDGWVFPDTSAHGKGEQPQHLYTVSFTSEVLWGEAGFSVNLDLFEPYLEGI